MNEQHGLSPEVTKLFGKDVKDKVDLYGWKVKDTPGALSNLNKTLLQVHPAYQRVATIDKINAIASKWSWVACGALIVGKRDKNFWVIDGQHRLLAALKRSDIKTLPCLIFQTDNLSQEAQGFLDANTARRPVATYDKYRAALAASDPLALVVDAMLQKLGITVTLSLHKAHTLKCIGFVLTRAKEDPFALEEVLVAAMEICGTAPIHERVLASLWYLHRNAEVNLFDKRLRARLKAMGSENILNAAAKAAAYYANGGMRVWAEGVLNEVNRGLRNKISLTKDVVDDE